MIELFEDDLNMPDRQSSKGNQLKFRRDGIWYKADYLGYEGLVEYTASKLLHYSNLKEDEFVDYELDTISYNGQIFNACKSRDFTKGWQLITLERLFKQMYGKGLNNMIYSVSDHVKRLELIVDQVERTTGIAGFGRYMCKTLSIDAFILNEDRHTHNLAVLTDNRGNFKLSPIFDNGAGLLSDTTLSYPMGRDLIAYIDKVKPKTFCDDFAEQVDIAERLYGRTLTFDFGYNEVRDIVDPAEQYNRDVRERVTDIVMQMRRKYTYMFAKRDCSF